MQAEIGRDGANNLDVSVFTYEEGMSDYYKPGVVYQGHPHDDEYPEMGFTPAQARELAAILLLAADEAEDREPMGALEYALVVLEGKHDPDEFADDPSLYTELREEAERLVRKARDEVAQELEQLPGTNLGMSVNRTQAINVARRV